jgi:alkylation response protein AidB-like acyl-CoA dehydrogenase
MDLRISAEDHALQARARAFTEEHLFPLELPVEEGNGLPAETADRMKRLVVQARLNAINQAAEHGGQGHDIFQQTLINEELGKVSGGLWQLAWQPGYPLRHGTAEQVREYLAPSCRGERRGCFAITEPGAGSDPRGIAAVARRRDGRYYLSGEKWHVTCADVCDFMNVLAKVDGDADRLTLFLVDKRRPGVIVKRAPKYMHSFVFKHLEMAFEEVALGEEHILGGLSGIGKGLDFVKEWFVETRLQIGAHCVGMASRAADVALAYASERSVFGRRLRDMQAIEFMLADMATEIMAAKSLVYRVAWEAANTADRRLLHARASAVKLFCSEMASRVIDAAVQVLGGRGYMRENPVERLYREVRVHRIWEGTSEIQRAIIADQVKKRGLEIYAGWIARAGDQ